MIEKSEGIALLLWKHLNNDLSADEKVMLDEWLARSETNRQLLQKIENPDRLSDKFKNFYELWDVYGDSLDEKFEKALPVKVIPIYPKKGKTFRWVAAASILLIVSAASYLLFFNKSDSDLQNPTAAVVNDVAPGTYKAKLSFDDGRTFILDKNNSGEIARQDGSVILNKDGQLLYSSTGNLKEVSYNTLTTARGETYPTVLSDGSKVHVNNETQIRYPVAFTGDERKLELKSGEAYFEISHDASKPFKVILNGAEIEVLGTQFAVSAFGDETQIKTSLLSGKVKISSSSAGAQILAPGQQANVDKSGNISIVKDADVLGSIAWVNGMLHFNQAELNSVLRQLARWYDVEVVYTKQPTTGKIKGEIDRNIPLSEVLQNLELIAKVNLKIEGKKIIVNP